jgi:hypothetical protein
MLLCHTQHSRSTPFAVYGKTQYLNFHEVSRMLFFSSMDEHIEFGKCAVSRVT